MSKMHDKSFKIKFTGTKFKVFGMEAIYVLLE